MRTRLFILWLFLATCGLLPLVPSHATVSTTAPRNDYIGTGTVATYSYTFRIFEAGDLRVTKRDTANLETALVLTTDYTVTGVNVASGGTITLVAGNLPTGYALTIRFDRTPKQSTDLRNQGSFFAEVHEDKFDELTRYSQQTKDVLDRSLHLPETEVGTSTATALPLVANRASKYLGFNSAGSLVALPAASGTAFTFDPLVPSYTKAGLPAGTDGRLAVVTDTIRGLFVYYSNQWFGVTFDEVGVRWFGAKCDGTTDDAASIQAAVDATTASSGGGQVRLCRGTSRILTAIAMKTGVDIVGASGNYPASIVNPVSVSAFTFAQTGGFGNTSIKNLSIEGTTTTTNIAIYQAGTENEADELYGITIDSVTIRNFNIGVKFRTVRNLKIVNSWFQDVNSAVHLIGECYNVDVFHNRFIKAAGSGTGTSTGVFVEAYTYTTGGTIRPEGVHVNSNFIYGFDYAVNAKFVTFMNVLDNDIAAAIYGVEYSTPTSVFNVKYNYIELTGAAGLAGIIGHGNASPFDAQINIEENYLIRSGAAAADSRGIQVNDDGNENQRNVRIVGNNETGFGSYDIVLFATGNVVVENNRLQSTGNANSILVQNASAGRGPIWIDKNDMAGTISFDGVDSFTLRDLVFVGVNDINSVQTYGGFEGIWRTPTFAAGNFTASGAMTWTVDAGDVTVSTYTIINKLMTVRAILETSTVGGTPSASLRMAIPISKVCTRRYVGVIRLIDNGVITVGYADIDASGTYINILRQDNANFTASTNATHVFMDITFEIN